MRALPYRRITLRYRPITQGLSFLPVISSEVERSLHALTLSRDDNDDRDDNDGRDDSQEGFGRGENFLKNSFENIW